MNYFLLALIFIILIITAWALMGKGDAREGGEEVTPERKFRRRAADQEIEREHPAETPQKGRRKSDRPGADGSGDEDDEPDANFKLPYSVDEIISDASRFRIYKRTLLNSEVYAKKGDHETAISLYEGVNERINDEPTNRKIEANIDYLKKFREFSEKRRKEKEEISKQFQGRKGNEIRVSIDGPLTIPDKIQIGIATPIQNIQKEKQIDIDKIVDEITSKLMGSDFFKRDSEERDRERQLKQYINEVASLKDGVDKILKSDRDLAKGIPAGALEKDGGIISGIQEQLKQMESRIEETAREGQKARGEMERLRAAGIKEADREPAVTAPKYTAPIPVTLDTKPIMELLDRLPRQTVPQAGPMKPPKGAESAAAEARGAGAAGGAAGQSSQSKEDIDREINTHEGEGPEEFELFSEYLKDTRGGDGDDGISDADIFEKLLKEDQEQIKDSFEIRGDRKEQDSLYNLSDKELERKRQDEERFYEKFLRHEKRVRKELPILKVTYDFSRLPDEMSLSKDKNILEYSLYKYKPLLEKADEFIRKRRVRDAINYYRTVMSQNVPAEFKAMIRKNISDLTEYLEKYLTAE
jgi:hypothetical protein